MSDKKYPLRRSTEWCTLNRRLFLTLAAEAISGNHGSAKIPLSGTNRIRRLEPVAGHPVYRSYDRLSHVNDHRDAVPEIAAIMDRRSVQNFFLQ
jgi:hypothetical protein